MDYLLVLLIGILIGWLLTIFWLTVKTRWESSKSLRSSYDKTVKELAEKGKKAQADKRKSRNTAVRAAIEFLLFVLVVFFLAVALLSALNLV